MSKVFPAAVVKNRFGLFAICFLLALGFLAAPFRPATVKAQPERQSPTVVLFSENFDGIPAPTLPSGWTTSATGAASAFVTSTVTSDSPPNAIFTTNPAVPSLSEIVSPPIAVGNTPSRLIFRHFYETEPDPGYDGGVLEISIAGGAFQDILAAGGTFASGGYVQVLNNDATGNPLLGRQVWTGTSSGFITTAANLPASALNQTVRFRWRYGTDEIEGGTGWRIDNVQVTEVVVSPVAGITFSNPNPINILDNTSANPYPSTINVANQGGLIDKVTVKLNGLNHTFPSDIDILLVGPGGQNALILSDVGGGTDAVNANITLDDEAATALSGAPLVSGTFRPTNISAGDLFPAPAPPSPNNAALSVFQGTNPNGAWNLFVLDDTSIDVGSIANGWELTITIANQFSNANAISVPDSGIAAPYPSTVSVAGLSPIVTKVQVRLNNFSHTAPDDVDLILASPDGRSVVLMSDVGGNNPLSNVNLIFDDAAPTSLPDGGQIVSGIYKPTDFEPGDAFPAPAETPSGRTLGTFAGGTANGDWKLFLVDDSGGNAGTISGGWTIIVDSATSVIAVPASGAAQPYPSDVITAGLQGSITKAVVTLNNFSHALPDDVDVLLVSPSGRKIVLMSDAGGTTEAGSVNLTFDDAAAANLPDNAPLASGTFKPTDYETGDAFPAPAPQSATNGTTLNAFYGSTPNGVWHLYIVDDNGGNAGTIASWSINLQTSVSACTFTLSPTGQGFPITGGSGGFTVNIPAGCPWSASTTSSFVSITSGATGEGASAVSFIVSPNMGGGRTASIVVTNGVSSQTFLVQQPSGCPFALSNTVQNVSAAGGTQTVSVSAGAACGYQATSAVNWIQIISGAQSGDGTISYTVLPNTTSVQRSGTITIGARTLTVNQAGASARRFDFDGDGKADVSVFRPSNGTWYILNSQNNSLSAAQFGLGTDKLVPADYDGDRRADFAVFRSGVWYILQSQTNTVRAVTWGADSDIVVPADYDGDGKADIAVWRPSDQNWYVIKSGSGATQATNFGAANDRPVPADFDGDGRADLAVYRSGATASWFVLQSGNSSVLGRQFGATGDIAVAADFDGDGRDNFAVFRPSTGTWYYAASDGTNNFGARQFGQSGDVPVAADYNGDGRADIGVFRSGVWYILLLGSETLRTEQWGLASDAPIPAAYNQP